MFAINLKNLLICFFCSIPPSNASVEQVFYIMGNILIKEHNQLLPETVKADIPIKINYNLNCEEVYHSITLLIVSISK